VDILEPGDFPEYSLLDCGDGRRLDSFCGYVIDRPDPHAEMKSSLSLAEWKARTHARFVETSSRSGRWEIFQPPPENWVIRFSSGNLDIRLRLDLGGFKNIGIFPEQALNWQFIFDQTMKRKSASPRILNLFAYTGGASLAACAAGGDVFHVDSARSALNRGRENMLLSGLDKIHWVLEDALKFVEREQKRKRSYQGVIMDPPAFGKGPKGELWKFEQGFENLAEAVKGILDEKDHFTVINTYSRSAEKDLIRKILNNSFLDRHTNPRELYIRSTEGNLLPVGIVARFATG
jgi:23S rRNA (cytosine1962-C5)-methyltransferase